MGHHLQGRNPCPEPCPVSSPLTNSFFPKALTPPFLLLRSGQSKCANVKSVPSSAAVSTTLSSEPQQKPKAGTVGTHRG